MIDDELYLNFNLPTREIISRLSKKQKGFYQILLLCKLYDYKEVTGELKYKLHASKLPGLFFHFIDYLRNFENQQDFIQKVAALLIQRMHGIEFFWCNSGLSSGKQSVWISVHTVEWNDNVDFSGVVMDEYGVVTDEYNNEFNYALPENIEEIEEESEFTMKVDALKMKYPYGFDEFYLNHVDKVFQDSATIYRDIVFMVKHEPHLVNYEPNLPKLAALAGVHYPSNGYNINILSPSPKTPIINTESGICILSFYFILSHIEMKYIETTEIKQVMDDEDDQKMEVDELVTDEKVKLQLFLICDELGIETSNLSTPEITDG